MDATTGSATVPTATCGATAVALLSRSTGTVVTCPAVAPVALANTSCEVSKSKPGRSIRLANTRSTFQAGRVSPRGRTTAWKLCNRPSAFTKLPEVSVKGAMGNSTSLNSILVLNGLRVTTISTLDNAAAALAPAALSCSGSLFSKKSPLSPPSSIWAAFWPPTPGMACTHCAPTVLAASVRYPTVAPVCTPIQLASASRLVACAWCAAALPSKTALCSPASNIRAMARAASLSRRP